jgi:hypothetical protein
MNFIRTGFRAIRRNLSLVFAEIAWRWAFGSAAWVVFVLAVRTILQGIDISPAEAAFARGSNAYRIADVVFRILVQVLPRAVEALVVLIPLLAVLWTLAATVGRFITLRFLVSAEVSDDAFRATPPARRPVLSLLLVNALRAVFALATFLAFFGTVFLVSAQFAPDQAAGTGPVLLLGWIFLALLVGLFWGMVNWFLALAPLFVMRDGLGAWRSIAASVGFYRDHRSEYATIVSWFGFFRAAALVLALIAGTVVFAAGSVRLVVALTIIVSLMYFAFADYLYIARLAAFVALASEPAMLVVPPLPPVVAPADDPVPPPNLELET